MDNEVKTLKEWRLDRGISQLKVAEVLGMSRDTLRNYENGLTEKGWTFRDVRQLVKIYRIGIDQVADD